MTRSSTKPEEVLEKLPYFSGLPGEIISEIAQCVRTSSLATREQALTEGEECKGLHFVVRGQVRLIKSFADGREQILAVLGPGTTFNDIAVFDGGPNPYNAVAVGETLLGFIPKARVLDLFERHPDMARAALKTVSARQRQLAAMVQDLAMRDVTARIARLLLGCVGRERHMLENAGSACERITHHEIASMIGSAREVVQRALKQLERDSAISLERARIRVRDIEKLERLAELD